MLKQPKAWQSAPSVPWVPVLLSMFPLGLKRLRSSCCLCAGQVLRGGEAVTAL